MFLSGPSNLAALLCLNAPIVSVYRSELTLGELTHERILQLPLFLGAAHFSLGALSSLLSMLSPSVVLMVLWFVITITRSRVEVASFCAYRIRRVELYVIA